MTNEARTGTPSGRPKAKVAVAGLGRMGRAHAASLAQSCGSAELVAVFDLQPGVAREVAGQLGVSAVPSYDDVVGDPSLDGVVIAAPTGAHAELAIAAAQCGKHVFCEKPLALERIATLEVLQAIEASGVKLQVGFHRRFDPASVAAAARVFDGELGDVYLLRTSQRDMAPPKLEFLSGSGGIFVDMGIHDFDLARWLVGEVATVIAHGAALSGTGLAALGDFDTAVVVLNFVNGALGVMDISRVAGYGYDSSVELMGSLATARVDEPFLPGYEWRTAGTASRRLVPTFDRRYAEAFRAELEQFARCIVEGTPSPVTGLDALAAFDLAQAAAESCRLGQPVAVPPTRGPAPVEGDQREVPMGDQHHVTKAQI